MHTCRNAYSRIHTLMQMQSVNSDSGTRAAHLSSPTSGPPSPSPTQGREFYQLRHQRWAPRHARQLHACRSNNLRLDGGAQTPRACDSAGSTPTVSNFVVRVIARMPTATPCHPRQQPPRVRLHIHNEEWCRYSVP
jgi:hypothetical protein